MANILNNKLVVIGLALGACTIFYFRVVGPTMDMFFPEPLEAAVLDIEEVEIFDAEGPDSFSGSTEQELQLANAKYNLTKIDVGHLRWNENPTRNPFSAADTKPKPLVKNVAPIQKMVVIESILPRVSAIVNSAKLKFAVIDGEILREGDVFGTYRLGRIESTSVALIHRSTGNWKKLAVTE